MAETITEKHPGTRQDDDEEATNKMDVCDDTHKGPHDGEGKGEKEQDVGGDHTQATATGQALEKVPEARGDANAGARAGADADGDIDGDADAEAGGDIDRDADRDIDGDAETDRDADVDADSDTDADQVTDADVAPDPNGDKQDQDAKGDTPTVKEGKQRRGRGRGPSRTDPNATVATPTSEKQSLEKHNGKDKEANTPGKRTSARKRTPSTKFEVEMAQLAKKEKRSRTGMGIEGADKTTTALHKAQTTTPNTPKSSASADQHDDPAWAAKMTARKHPQEGNVVWTKVAGYPWWPAVVSSNSEDKFKIRDAKLAKKAPASRKRKSNTGLGYKFLVTFYNDGKSAWIPQGNIRPYTQYWTQRLLATVAKKYYEKVKEAVDIADKAVEDSDYAYVWADHSDDEHDEQQKPHPSLSIKKESKARKASVTNRDQDSTDDDDQNQDDEDNDQDDEDQTVDNDNQLADHDGEQDNHGDDDDNDHNMGDAFPRPKKKSKRKSTGTSGGGGGGGFKRRASTEEASGGGRAKKQKSMTPLDQLHNQNAQVLKKKDERIKELEAELKTVKAEIRNLVKDAKQMTPGIPAKMEPTVIEKPRPGVSGEACTMSEQVLNEMLNVLNQEVPAYAKLFAEIKSERRGAAKLLSSFKTSCKTLEELQGRATVCEQAIVKALSSLLSSDISFDMLRKTQAGKPVKMAVKLMAEINQPIGDLAEALVAQWRQLITERKTKAAAEGGGNAGAAAAVLDPEKLPNASPSANEKEPETSKEEEEKGEEKDKDEKNQDENDKVKKETEAKKKMETGNTVIADVAFSESIEKAQEKQEDGTKEKKDDPMEA